ncbi:MAG: hypothetical protein ACK5CO_00160, partial [Bacteroidota bacterium]
YTSTNKTMIIALDQKRNKQDSKAVSVSSMFCFHTEDGKNTNKNNYWNFVSCLAKSSFFYLTDIYKIYYKTKDMNICMDKTC